MTEAPWQFLADVQAIASAADSDSRELTSDEVARIRAIYRQLDADEADAEAADGWQSS
jgi:hypothetical protein